MSENVREYAGEHISEIEWTNMSEWVSISAIESVSKVEEDPAGWEDKQKVYRDD